MHTIARVLVVVSRDPSPQQSSEELGEVFVSLKNSLRNFLRRRVDETAVEDLLQEIFVKALSAIRKQKAPKNLPGWLYAAARTTVVDYYRARNLSTNPIEEDTLNAPELEEEMLEIEIAACLRPLVMQLPDKYRYALTAVDFEGRTMNSVAEEVGLSTSAIKSRASRARAKLKEMLLACCHVEVKDGVFTDFQCKSKAGCGDTGCS